MLPGLRRLLPALWAGVLICIAAIAAPAAFANLAVADAGRVVAPIFVREAWLSLVLAALLLALERLYGAPGRVNGLLLWGTAACTLLGYFAIQPLMPAARAGQGVLSFGQLHLISTLCYGLKTALVLVLAWRLTGDLSRRPSS
jgi:Domain of unknown function (DUF4149)